MGAPQPEREDGTINIKTCSVLIFHKIQDLTSSAIVSICLTTPPPTNSISKDSNLHCLEELVGPVSPVVSRSTCRHRWRVVGAEEAKGANTDL